MGILLPTVPCNTSVIRPLYFIELEIHQSNGKVYGIKVIPKHGKPYYLVDMKGDGKFIQSQDERLLVPQWVILSW